MYKYAILTFLILTSCSKENLEFNVPTTSEVEKLIKHSDEFNQEVITFDTPGGKIHFAIGFGIANPIMVEVKMGISSLMLLIVDMMLKKYMNYLKKRIQILSKQSFTPIIMVIIPLVLLII